MTWQTSFNLIQHHKRTTTKLDHYNIYYFYKVRDMQFVYPSNLLQYYLHIMLKKRTLSLLLSLNLLCLASCSDDNKNNISADDVYYLISSEIDTETNQQTNSTLKQLTQQLEQATFNINIEKVNVGDALEIIAQSQETIVYGKIYKPSVTSLKMENADIQRLIADLLKEQEYIADYKLNGNKHRLHRLWLNTTPESFLTDHSDQKQSNNSNELETSGNSFSQSNTLVSDNIVQFADAWSYASENKKNELLYEIELSGRHPALASIKST